MKKFFLFLAAMLMCSIGQVRATDYVKVTSAPTTWDGEYILVYEVPSTDSVCVFSGVDAADGFVPAKVADNVISGSFATISIISGEKGDSIKVNGGTNDGKYVTYSSNNNGLTFGAASSAALMTITWEDNSVKITNAGGAVMRYNKDKGQHRFRFYKSATYAGQQPVQLYSAPAPAPVPVTSVTLDQHELAMVVGGDPVTLVATVLPEDADDKTVTWSVAEGGETVVSVAEGVVSALAAGEAKVIAAAGDFKDTCVVTVTAPVVGPPTKDYAMTVTSVAVEDVSAPTYNEYDLTIMATGVYGGTSYCYEIDATIDPEEASIAGTFTYDDWSLGTGSAVMWLTCSTSAMQKTRYIEEGSTLTITSKGNNKYGLTGKLICADRTGGEITTILNYNFDTEFEFEFAPEVPATQYGIRYYCPNNPDDGGVYRHIYSTDCKDVFGDSTMSYDPEKKELTLNNYKVDLNGAQSAYPIINDDISGLKIILKGENELISGTSTALRLYATTTLAGEGKLTATAIGSVSDGIYISGGGNLTIDGCEVIANSAYGIEGSEGTLTITNGAKVSATGAISGSVTGWGSIVLGEGIQILSPAGAQIVGGDVKDAEGALLKSEVVIGVPSTIVVPATSVTLDKDTLNMYMGAGTATLTATVLPENTTDFVEWSVVAGGESFVSVVAGTVTALAEGEAKVVAKAGNVSDTCVVVVGPAPVDYNITVNTTAAGNIQITSANCTDVLNDGGSFKFDNATKTITLTNCHFTSDTYPLVINQSVNIVLVGENSITSTISATALKFASGDATIGGGGKLTLSCLNTGGADGIYCPGGNLTINECEIYAEGGYGIEGGSTRTLTINPGAKVTAYGPSKGSFTGWGSIVLGEGVEILSPAGAQIVGGDVKDAEGALLKSEVVIGKKETLASVLEGKTIRRAVADNEGVFVLAIDANKVPSLVKADFEGNIITRFATDFCTVAGTQDACMVLGDIALTADGVLVGINAENTTTTAVRKNDRNTMFYKWAADGTGEVWIDGATLRITSSDSNPTSCAYGNGMAESFAVNGTLDDCIIALRVRSISGANLDKCRMALIKMVSGEIANINYNQDLSIFNVTSNPVTTLVAAPTANDFILVREGVAPAEWTPNFDNITGASLVATMAADYNGINGFSFATVEEAKWMLVPANDGVKVLDVTAGLDQAAVLHELAAAEMTPAYKYAALVTVEGVNKVMLLRDANITMLDISAPVEPVFTLNPYAFGVSASSEGDVVTINYSLNVDAAKVTAQIFNGETMEAEIPLQGITKGAHSEDIDLSALELARGKHSFKVSVEGVAHEFTTYADSTVTFNNRYHATVDANPMSPNFGNIYGACRYDKVGIFRITPDYTYLNTEPAMIGQSSWASVQRGAVAPNGEMWFSTWGDSNSGIFRYNPSVKIDSCTQFFIGTRASDGLITNNGEKVGCSTPGIAIYSAGKDSKLYMICEDFLDESPRKGSLAIYNIGQEDGSIVTSWDKAPSAHYTTMTDRDGTNFAMAATPYGVWICQNRALGSNNAGARSLQFIGNDGVQRYLSTDAELINGSYGAGIVTNAAFDKLWMVDGNGNIAQFSVAWAGEAEAMAPSLTMDTTYTTPFGAIAQMTFDFAGNIVAVGGTGNTPYGNNASVLRLAVFSLPAVEAPVAVTPVVDFEYEVVGMRGAYLVGGEEADFASLYAACDSVNKAVLAGDLTGDVDLLIAADLVEPVNIGLFNTTDHTVTIRPDQDANRTVLFTQATDNEGPSGAFVIGCDMGITFTGIATKNIVIDGFAEGGDTRRLTFTTTDGFGSKAGPIVFYGDVTNSAIQNCIVTNTIYDPSTSAYAITLRNERNTDKCPVGVIIENNEIEVLVANNGQGIYLNGSQAATAKVGAPKNTIVRNNVITAATRGIFLYGANGLIVENNTIRVRQHAGGRLSHGIMGNSQTGVITVRGNIFDELTTVNTTAGDYGIQAITASGGADVWMIENNYFGGFDAGTACAGQPTKICGVRMGDSCVVRHNTFEMPVLSNTPSTTLLTNAPITLLYYAGTLNYVVENNILISHETAANNSLVRGTISSNSKGNLFWLDETTPTNAVVMDAGTPAATFADLDPAIQAVNINEKVELVDTYKLADEYIGKKVLGVAALADVTVDIEGQERHTPLTYVGCYEASDLNGGGTDLNMIQAEDGAARKVLHRGHMYIIREGKMFNVNGMRVR